MSDIVERLRRQANAMLHPAVRDEMSIATAFEREQEAHRSLVERMTAERDAWRAKFNKALSAEQDEGGNYTLVNEIERLTAGRDDLAVQVERTTANHKDAVETKRKTDNRLRIALAGLQKVYSECGLDEIRKIAGDAFNEATEMKPLPALPFTSEQSK